MPDKRFDSTPPQKSKVRGHKRVTRMGSTWVRTHWRMTSTQMKTGGWFYQGGKRAETQDIHGVPDKLSLEDRMEQASYAAKDAFEGDGDLRLVFPDVERGLGTNADMFRFRLVPKDPDFFIDIGEREMDAYEYVEDNYIGGLHNTMNDIFGWGNFVVQEWNVDHANGELYGHAYIQNEWRPYR
jgi:hypothetical protein